MGLKHSKKVKHYLYADQNWKDRLENQLLTGCLEFDFEKVTQALDLGVPVNSPILYQGKHVHPLHVLFIEPRGDRVGPAKRDIRARLLALLVQEYRVDVNTPGPQGKTVLHQLCTWQSIGNKGWEGPKLLATAIGNGADPNLKDDKGNTPLHYCCQAYCRDLLDALLRCEGMDVNAENNEGTTCLHLAASTGNSDLVRKLMDGGADINHQTHLGNTPLHDAFSKKTTYLPGAEQNFVSILLSHGARVNIVNNSGQTACSLALDAKLHSLNYSLLNKFLRKSDTMNFTDSKGNSLLHLLCTSELQSNGNCMQYNYLRFVALGVNGNVRNLAGLTALELCIDKLYLNMYRWIPYRFPTMFVHHLRAGTDIRRMPIIQKAKFLELCCQCRPTDLVKMINYARSCGFGSIYRSPFEEENCEMDFMENEQLMTLLGNNSDIESLQGMCANIIRLSLYPNPVVAANKLPLSSYMIDVITFNQLQNSSQSTIGMATYLPCHD